MTEHESQSVDIKDFVEAFPYSNGKKSLARSITATKYFSNERNERKLLLIASESPKKPHTTNLLSNVEAEERKEIIQGNTIRLIAYSKSARDLYTNNHFRELVLDPIKSWSASEHARDTEVSLVEKGKKDLQKSVSGVIYNLYKEEMVENGFDEDKDFARYLFPGERTTITPYTYNESLVSDIQSELAQQ